MLKQKLYLHLGNLAQLNDLKCDFVLINNCGFGRYLFHHVVLLKPYFNCGNNFALSCVDKVTTGT